MLFNTLETEFVAAKPYYRLITTSWQSLLPSNVAKYFKYAYKARKLYHVSKNYFDGATVEEIVGNEIFTRGRGKLVSPFSKKIVKTHHRAAKTHHDIFRKNGIGGRTWITEPGRYDMNIMFHDANRAGPHIDVHIGRFSVIYKVKPDVYAQLKYDSAGYLTHKSKELLLDFVREEISGNSRVPQNIDHTYNNARSSWVNGDPEGKNYGDGRTRQEVLSTKIDVYKAYENGPIEFYAPALDGNKSMYIYEIYHGKTPILIWGHKKSDHPPFEDRLHLKLAVEDDPSKMDLSTSTLKYDGSSAYIVVGPKGTKIYSPRYSVVSGDRIDYTQKLNTFADAHNDETVIMMGEVVFKKKTWDPFAKKEYLPAATGSGILNSYSLLDKNIEPEIRIYRVDKVGRKSTIDLSFEENRELQQEYAKLHKSFKVVDKMTPENAHRHGHEGVVIAPYNGNVNNAYKVKYVDDALDWRILKVDLKDGPTGNVAGVVRCRSEESDKEFNLGPGQMGDHKLCRDMMKHPEKYEGRVVKVTSRRGHEGRASKVIGFHDDK